MKNLILGVFLVLTSLLISQACLAVVVDSSASAMPASPELYESPSADLSLDNATPAPEKKSLWKRLKSAVKGNLLEFVFATFIAGMFTSRGWSLILKRFAGKGKFIMKEVGEFAEEGQNWFGVLESKIADDGRFKENTIKDLISAGKPVLAEFKDVVVSIKPKSKLKI